MLPHPNMSFAWEEEVVRPTRVLIAVFLLALMVLAGTPVLIELALHDTPAAVADQSEAPLPSDPMLKGVGGVR